jgi:hypothetical protein
MSRTYKDSAKGSGRERHISVRGVRRKQPDLRRMSRALVQLALAEAAAEAAAEVDEEMLPDQPKAADGTGCDSEATDD